MNEKITSLISNCPNNVFIELMHSMDHTDLHRVKKLDDFLRVSGTDIGFTIDIIDAKTHSERYLNDVFLKYLSENEAVLLGHNILDPYEFRNYLIDNINSSPKMRVLKTFCTKDSFEEVYLYSLEKNIYWAESLSYFDLPNYNLNIVIPKYVKDEIENQIDGFLRSQRTLNN